MHSKERGEGRGERGEGRGERGEGRGQFTYIFALPGTSTRIIGVSLSTTLYCSMVVDGGGKSIFLSMS